MFHVYVEGVTRAAPDAARKVSDAMAERYGLSELKTLVAYMQSLK